MRNSLQALDRILRDEATRVSALQRGTIDIPAAGLVIGLFFLAAALYGLCMGCYALTSGHGGGAMQMAASMLKVPALFFLTLLVTFPSLYVFNAQR
ncbi:MAG: hypothetical protein ACREIT_05075 [Tepidisphaeraceae bacterium]